jgi:hypothetical protein
VSMLFENGQSDTLSVALQGESSPQLTYLTGKVSTSPFDQPTSTSTSAAATVTVTATASPRPNLPDNLPVDVNFWYFLLIYYGAYLAVALIWVTCLFNLYRCRQPLYLARQLHTCMCTNILLTHPRYLVSKLVASKTRWQNILFLFLVRRIDNWSAHSLFRHFRYTKTST